MRTRDTRRIDTVTGREASAAVQAAPAITVLDGPDAGGLLVAALIDAGLDHGEPLGLAISDRGVAFGLTGENAASWTVRTSEPADVVRAVESAIGPRWTWWDAATPTRLTAADVRVARCWDVGVVHRLLSGGWRTDPALAWAALHDLDPDSVPSLGQLDLLGVVVDDGGDPDDPVGPDGHLRPEWVAGGWGNTPQHLARWARTATRAASLQMAQLDDERRLTTAWSESAAELLCTELAADGLPLDRSIAAAIITEASGPPPHDDAHAARLRSARDARVLDLLDGDLARTDLRNPAHVKALLARLGFDVPDTRSWRLEPFRGSHPVIDALLTWRKAERIATTYGHGWLATHVGPDGRLRGAWSSTDGAAGRMTAQAGLHNLPAELRPAVAAGRGHVLVRADLGQIEPRVLAVVSGDPALAGATGDDDLYAPVAAQLGVDRPTAKIAVLAAMYGQTSGTAGQSLARMQRTYPRAIAYLDAAAEQGRAGRDLRTVGGRLVRMPGLARGLDENQERAARGGRGRFARNALVQGAAAEFFKMWAVSVRARLAGTDARIVLCLHDELLLHGPADDADAMVGHLRDALADTARRWQPAPAAVRFVADIAVVDTWADAKH